MSPAVPWPLKDSHPQPSTIALITQLKPATPAHKCVHAHTCTHTPVEVLRKSHESFATDVFFQSNNLLSTAEHLFSDEGTCQDGPLLHSRHIHLWNNTQLKDQLLTMWFLFFCLTKQTLFNSAIFLFNLLLSANLTPVVPLDCVNSPQQMHLCYCNWLPSSHIQNHH